MTTIRLVIRPSDVDGDRATVRGAELRYLACVRRARAGESVELIDGTGRVLRGVLAAIGRSEAAVREVTLVPPRTSTPITLALGLGRSEPLDRAVRAASELGVSRLVAIRSEFSIARRPAALAALAARWRRIAIEGLRSSGNAAPAEVAGPAGWAEWTGAPGDGTRLLLDANGDPIARAVAVGAGATPAGWVLAVGPEGGWSDGEKSLAVSRGFAPVSLCRSNLRVEVAAIGALAVLRSTDA